jgi:exosortase
MVNSTFSGKFSREPRFVRLTAFLASVVVVGATIYPDTLLEMATQVLRREDSSHGLFVPLLSLYFIWWKRSSLRDIKPKTENLAGLAVLVGGLSLSFVAKAHEQFYWECVSFIVVLAGLVICFYGIMIFKKVGFPIFFLIFMIPIPEPMYNSLADWVRQATMKASTGFLATAGVPFLREELLIHLPNTTLRVNIGCSGIRYLLSYFVFVIAYAYLFRSRLEQRILLIGLTIPVSLMASTLRLTGIALLAYYVSPQLALHRPHIVTSWLIFFSVLVFSVGFDRWLSGKKGGGEGRFESVQPHGRAHKTPAA